ncbi:class I SAM-dependent methyltransferase [Rhodococcus chondri]|uniref:Class I SAM-dependent methyltransferase n=1 Tax=Rhodococcus chondri TaxID=3065941 RepID=A0ABU7JPU9_9NOCA|nr:class I SAM-dependent methyltransferase [Rhodococcus sp. CC-R104]MEE2032056.1 class I SAM-dependent methyltransferase [Rhodococcus sp. CC-R104]
MPDDTSELARTFDEVSGDFDALTPTVWGPAGQALVFQLGVRPDDRVLDACCGTGASALPAAAAVGPNGRVHGVDVAGNLLECGRLVAEQRALKNIDFVCADVTTWEPPSDVPAAGYDALAISYGVFFLPHMDSAFARLVGLVRNGGRVGVTVWRADGIDRFTELAFDVASRHSPRLADGQHAGKDSPWRAISTPPTLEAWLAAAGTHSVEVRTLSNLLPATAELCWNFVMATGLRALLSGLDAEGIDAVRRDIADEITARSIHTIDATTLVGTATVRRPPATV